jgi:hypothetical protein
MTRCPSCGTRAAPAGALAVVDRGRVWLCFRCGDSNNPDLAGTLALRAVATLLYAGRRGERSR